VIKTATMVGINYRAWAREYRVAKCHEENLQTELEYLERMIDYILTLIPTPSEAYVVDNSGNLIINNANDFVIIGE